MSLEEAIEMLLVGVCEMVGAAQQSEAGRAGPGTGQARMSGAAARGRGAAAPASPGAVSTFR